MQAGQVLAETARLGADAAHLGPVREQLRDAAERDRRLHAAETVELQPQPIDRLARHAGRARETRRPELRRESDPIDPVVAGESEPPEAGQLVRQSDLRLPADVLRPEASGRPRFVQESAHDRAGRRRRPPRGRAQSQSESNRHHLREAGRVPTIEDAAIRGELPAAELDSPQDSQGFQGLGVGARRESLRDEAVRGPGRLRYLHGTIYGGQEEDVLKDNFMLGKNNACIICVLYVRNYSAGLY